MQCIPASHLPLHQERVESESRPDLLTTRVSLPLSLSPSLTGTLCDRPAHTIKFMTTPTENRPEDPKSPALLFDGSFNFSDAYFDSGALHYLCKLFNPSSSIDTPHLLSTLSFPASSASLHFHRSFSPNSHFSTFNVNIQPLSIFNIKHSTRRYQNPFTKQTPKITTSV